MTRLASGGATVTGIAGGPPWARPGAIPANEAKRTRPTTASGSQCSGGIASAASAFTEISSSDPMFTGPVKLEAISPNRSPAAAHVSASVQRRVGL